MDIENLAVSKLTDELAKCDLVLPFLNTGDREPSWDGHIYVYQPSDDPDRCPKGALLRRIPVQIKGQVGRLQWNSISYPVQIADLKNYVKEDGILYFVVRIREDGEARRIYYRFFPKWELETQLQELSHPGQKQKSFKFKPFPERKGRIKALLTGFCGEMNEQAQTVAGPGPKLQGAPDFSPLWKSPYLYTAGTVGFYGRDAEKEALRGFLNQNTPFSWWGITGPGGAGKSRLAWELKKELEEEGRWQVHVLGREVYTVDATGKEDLRGLNRLAEAEEDTLLLADYAGAHAAVLGKWLEGLAERLQREDPQEPGPRLRVLLLERDTGKIREALPWEQEMNGSGYRFQSFRYAPILSLGPIREANASIILDFAAALRKREKGLPELDEARAADLAARLPELDPQERPLFAMFLADAWLHDPDGTRQSKPTDIFDDLANREEKLVARRVEGLMGREDRGLSEACLGLWRAATVLGSNSWDVSLERLRSFYPDWWMVLERKAEACGDPYGAENLLYRLGLSDGARFPALRPDLLGEYFILRWLLCPKAPLIAMKSVEPFYLGVLREFRLTTAFFYRLFFDWHVRISWAEQSGGEPWSSLLPELKLDPDRAYAYCIIHSDAFEWQGAAAVRRDTAARMERLAAKQPSGSPQRAGACNRLGLVYKALGDLPRATRYLEENCRFNEVFLGEQHPNTAASYNNLAIVYRDVGEYRKALEYCKKALKIWESVLGPEHPKTAATKLILAALFRELGKPEKQPNGEPDSPVGGE